MATQTKPSLAKYQHLEYRAGWRQQPYIKGTNRWVGGVVPWMLANKMTPGEVAEDIGIPEEAVYECLRYFDRHRDIIEGDAQAERDSA